MQLSRIAEIRRRIAYLVDKITRTADRRIRRRPISSNCMTVNLEYVYITSLVGMKSESTYRCRVPAKGSRTGGTTD